MKFIFPILAGLSIVLQGALNRNLSSQIGLVSAVYLNALVFLVLSAGYWALMRFGVIESYSMISAKPLIGLNWWDYLPGIFGFMIVFSTPVAIQYLGANLTFSMIICTQLLISMIWDAVETKAYPTPMSCVGVGIMLVGLAVLMNGRK